MATAQSPRLEELIEKILRHAEGKPLTIPEIEQQLAGTAQVDTFDVRDAVWRLVAENRAQFDPRRRVKFAGQ